METDRTCTTCQWNLGSGGCRAHLELGCAEGGGYEAWQPRTTFRSVADAAEYADEIGWTTNISIAQQDNGLYALRMEENK